MHGQQKPLVLLVEDDARVRACLALMLKHPGFELIVCRHGMNALAVAKTLGRHVNLLVTDVVMPKMSGYALAQKLRAEHPGMKTIYISGHLPDAPQLQSLIERNELILFKPFEPDLLLRTVLNDLQMLNRQSRLTLAQVPRSA